MHSALHGAEQVRSNEWYNADILKITEYVCQKSVEPHYFCIGTCFVFHLSHLLILSGILFNLMGHYGMIFLDNCKRILPLYET